MSRTLNVCGAHVLPQCLHFICWDAMSKTMLPLHFKQRKAIILSHFFLVMYIMGRLIANLSQITQQPLFSAMPALYDQTVCVLRLDRLDKREHRKRSDQHGKLSEGLIGSEVVLAC